MALFRPKKGIPSEDITKRFEWLRRDLYTKWIMMTYPFAEEVKSLSVHFSCSISRRTARRIKLGNGVQLDRDVWINIEAPPEGAEPVLILEDGCAIGRRAQISAKNLIHLERDVITGADLLLMDHNHAYEDITRPIKVQGVTEGGKIRIGEGSFIGQGVTIVCGHGELVIGKHCVVAVNSVVTRNFPPYSVISGNPARIVRQFDPVKNAWVLGASSPSSANQDVSESLAPTVIKTGASK